MCSCLKNLILYVILSISVLTPLHAMDDKDPGLREAHALISKLYTEDPDLKNTKSDDYIPLKDVVQMMSNFWGDLKQKSLSPFIVFKPTQETIREFIRVCLVKQKACRALDTMYHQKCRSRGLIVMTIISVLALTGFNVNVYTGGIC